MSVLTFQNVTVNRDGRTVLDIDSLHLTEQRIGLVGSNGSGKSTMLRVLDGLVTPDQGTATVNGLDPVRQGRQVRRHVGLCFQNPGDQIISPVVGDDVAFGLKNQGVKTAERQLRVQEILQTLRIEHLRSRLVSTLSGGERQLVALAAVLVMQPQTLLCDEPTDSLDLHHRLRLQSLMAGLPQQMLVATHDLDLLQNFDRVLVLHQGQILADDAPAAAIAVYRKLAAAQQPFQA